MYADLGGDRYNLAYKPITLLYISFMFIEMKFIHFHSFMIFILKSISTYNDFVNYKKGEKDYNSRCLCNSCENSLFLLSFSLSEELRRGDPTI